MANLLDYLDWRGDFSWEQAPFNEIDAAIFARLVYLPLSGVFPSSAHSYPLAEVARRFWLLPEEQRQLWEKRDLLLLDAAASSPRFALVQLLAYQRQLDSRIHSPFTALTFCLGKQQAHIAFRGTDDTLASWQENLSLCDRAPVAAQQLALRYLQSVLSLLPPKISLSGHSKGGNLAVYAAACAPEATQARIYGVYNYDGPGFSGEFMQTPGYCAIQSRINTYVPQSSIVGMLLPHQESYRVVYSERHTGFLQHNLYSWQVRRNRFLYLRQVSASSRFVAQTMQDWLLQLDDSQRQQCIGVLFDILRQTQAHTLHELAHKWFSNGRQILASYHHLDASTRQAVLYALRLFFSSARKEAHLLLPEATKSSPPAMPPAGCPAETRQAAGATPPQANSTKPTENAPARSNE